MSSQVKDLKLTDVIFNSSVDIITGAGAITEPLDADEFPFYKIVGTLLKKVTWVNIKATLKTYFDELYAAVLGANDNYVTDAEKFALHTQHTDTGTTGNTFTVDSDSTTGKIVLDVALNAGQNRTLTITNAAMTADVVTTIPATTGTLSLVGHNHIIANNQLAADYTILVDDTWEEILTTTIPAGITPSWLQIIAMVTFQDVPGFDYQSDVRILRGGVTILGIGTLWVVRGTIGTLTVLGFVEDGVTNDVISVEVRRKAGDVILFNYDTGISTQMVISQ